MTSGRDDERGLIDVVWGFSSASPSELDAARGEFSLRFLESGLTPLQDRIRRALARIGKVSTIDSSLGPCDGIVAYSDAEILPAAERAAASRLRFHSVKTAELLTRKDAQRDALTAAGMVQPGHVTAHTINELHSILAEVPLPVVVKPVQGTASRHVHEVSDRYEAKRVIRVVAAARDILPILVEDRLVGTGHPTSPWLADFVSVETATFDGEHSHFGVTGRLPLRYPLRETGSIVPALLPTEWESAVIDEAERALDALGVRWGVTHTEIKLTERGPVVIEVNGRLGGAINELYTLTGRCSPVHTSLRIAVGLPPEVASPETSAAVVLWRHLDDDRPDDNSLRQVQDLPETVRIQVPPRREHDGGLNIHEGRLVPPLTVVLLSNTVSGVRCALKRCHDLLGIT